MRYELAELNIARLRAPLDDPATAEFVAALGEVNALAEASDGFVWRLVGEDGRSSSYVSAFDDPLLIVNLSVWSSVEALRAFTYRSDHTPYLRRKRDWFEPLARPHLVCWWVPEGTRPTVPEAIARLEALEAHGAGPDHFPLKAPFGPPEG